MAAKNKAGISVFQKYLTVWVILCMVVGVLTGRFLPQIPAFLNQFEYARVSIPMAILIWVMIYPMMMKVDLATTDPATHLKFVLDESSGISMSRIDEAEELRKYQNEVLSKAKAAGLSGDDLAYIEENLRSPCTQEIAVFRAFAEIVEKADDQIVVIDTAPTGHTLLLLESTQSYSRRSSAPKVKFLNR